MKKFTLSAVGILIAFTNNLNAQEVLRATNGAVITVQNGASLFVGGGITLENNSTLNNTGIIIIAGTADFIDNTVIPYNYGTGKFVFTGTGTQNINSLNQFERIDVEDAGLTLSSDIKSNAWYLKAGKVNTGAFNAIATSTVNTAVEADVTNTNFTNSWINGKLRRYISPATVNNYQFPVGDATKVNIAELDNLTATPLTGVTYITASFGPKPGNDAGLNVSEFGTAYSSINTGGVWYLVPDANPTAGKYDLKLFFNGFTGLADNSFAILRRPDASSNAAEWIVPAGTTLPAAGNPGRTVTGGFARRNNISTFSQLGIGITLAPLPLQLLSFGAAKKDKNVLLEWITLNEINTSHFELFRGNQPASLQYLDKLAAAGFNTGSLNYNYLDKQPLKGLSYYQLKMVDNNNTYKWSQVVKINFDDISSFTIYPNPVINNEFFIKYNSIKVNELKLIAADGKQVDCSFVNINQDQLKVTLHSVLAKGVYTIQLNTNKGVKSTMVVVQ